MTRDYRGLMLTSTSYSGSTAITTTYNYDDRGNLTAIIDPLGRTTSYGYDGINRNTKVIYPDLKEMNYTYDKNSNLITKTDPNGTVVTNTYDSMNRLTGRSISRGSGVGGVTSETYTYDALGRLITAGDNAYVTLTGASYSGVAVNNLSFSYDALSRLTSESQTPIAGT
jgi:YD repeat-containing protein